MTVAVLAEKPSVARDIAAFVGARARKDGYFEGNDYQVTWAFGHLVTLKEPDEYDPSMKRWTLETLPFIPDEFQLKLTGDDLPQDNLQGNDIVGDIDYSIRRTERSEIAVIGCRNTESPRAAFS